MADFPMITRLMEEQGLDALLTLGMRNCAYLAGDVTEEPWLNEPQGLGAWMTCIAPPDKSFAIGGSRMADFDMPLDRLRPDQTRDSRSWPRRYRRENLGRRGWVSTWTMLR